MSAAVPAATLGELRFKIMLQELPAHDLEAFHKAAIADYRAMIRSLMLSRIAAFTTDSAFIGLADELGEIVGCERAAAELYAVTHNIYLTAEAA